MFSLGAYRVELHSSPRKNFEKKIRDSALGIMNLLLLSNFMDVCFCMRHQARTEGGSSFDHIIVGK